MRDRRHYRARSTALLSPRPVRMPTMACTSYVSRSLPSRFTSCLTLAGCSRRPATTSCRGATKDNCRVPILNGTACPFQASGHPPVLLAEHECQRRHQERANQEGVHEQPERDREAHLKERLEVEC